MALFDWNPVALSAQADEVAHCLDRLSKGDLSATFPNRPGLAARLAPSIDNLRGELVRQRADAAALGTALTEMSKAQAAGTLDAVIPAEALAEPYRAIANTINALVKAHVDNVRGELAAERAQAAALATALTEMTQAHTAGAIDAVIPAETLATQYRAIANTINALVKAHIDVKMKVVSVVTSYANGDFSVAMDRLPGKKAMITEAIDRVRELLPKPEEIMTMKRARAALECASSGIMITDVDNVIRYMNRSVTAMMRDAERDLQKDLPNFRADSLLSTKIDQFHKNPSHQTNMLADLRGTHSAQIVVGGRTMGLVLNPLFDEQGVRIGSVAEWKDRTLEVAVERETGAIVDAAARGDFSQRLVVEGRAAFTNQLEGMNRLMGTCETALTEIVRVLGALARNDFTQTITKDYEGLFGQLKDDTNSTIESLTKTVIEIKGAAEIVSASIHEISEGNGNLSQRTEEQAASLIQTAASMEELTATVLQNADNAKEASKLAISASSVAVLGGEVVGEVVQTMAAINGSAKKIVDIISVIDGIAFQTNILALNAAVEAARAGEQGRGFAVVAGEVRTLAQRSAAAAKEIKELIGDSVEKTNTGSKLVDQAGERMVEIVASVKRVTDIMASIAHASEEQGAGIGQVNEAVSQMDAVVQQNASLVEEIAASAEALEQRAQSLVGLVAVFTLPGHAGGSLVQASPAPRAVHAVSKAPKPSRVVAPTKPRPVHKGAPTIDPDSWSSF